LTSYANGYTVKERYDVYGRLVGVYRVVNGNDVLEKECYYFDNDEMPEGVSGPLSENLTRNAGSKLRMVQESGRRYDYTYDVTGKMHNVKEYVYASPSTTTSAEYDEFSRVKTHTFIFGDENYHDRIATQFDYNDSDEVISSVVTYANNTWTHETGDDPNGKRFSESVRLVNSGISTNLTYYSRKNALGQFVGTTDYLKKAEYSLKKGAAANPVSLGSDVFEYDVRGNVTKVISGNYVTQYGYDGLDRLIREDNQKLNKTFVFTYDAGGNILTKKEYAYTTGTPTGVLKTYNYQYDTVWKDKMTSFDNKSCAYDASGNPTTYKGKTFTWSKGRRLLTAQSDYYGTVSYYHDADGKVRSIDAPGWYTYLYLDWDGNRIVRERILTDANCKDIDGARNRYARGS